MNVTRRLFGWLDVILIAVVIGACVGCHSSDTMARPGRDLARLIAKAESGNPRAQYELGEIYANGDGVPRNEEEAFNWIQRAAMQGHVNAQYDLGMMFKDGRGTGRDFVEAYKWFSLSAAGGHVNGEVRMQAVRQGMTRDQFAEAQRAAMSFAQTKAMGRPDKPMIAPVKKSGDENFRHELSSAPPSKTTSQFAQPSEEKSQKAAQEPVFSPVPPPNPTSQRVEETKQPAAKVEERPVSNSAPAATNPPVEEPVKKKSRKAKKEPVFQPVPPPSGQ